MNASRFSLRRLPRGVITILLASHDAIMAAGAMQIAIWLRSLFPAAPSPDFDTLSATLVFAGVAAGVFYVAGLHRGVWRFTAFTNLVTIVKAASIAVLVFVPAYFLVTRLDLFPRAVLILLWPILILMLAVPRFLFRLWSSGTFSGVFQRGDGDRIPVLVLGLSQEADRFIEG